MQEAGFLGGEKEQQIEELANRIDDQDPQAEEALTFYEDQVIKALEVDDQGETFED
jgi:hypothetical protein